ncbi:MAG: hypothetical protein Q9187_008057, partial [Circinaria calcarea]
MSWATMDWKAQAALPSITRRYLHPPSEDPQIKLKAVDSPNQQLARNTDDQTLDMVTGVQPILEIPLTLDNRPDGDEHLKEFWQSYDLPQELRLVQAGTPQEIRTIITDSMNHFQAVKDSLQDPVVYSNLLAEPFSTILTSSVKERIPSTSQNFYVPHERLDSLGLAPALDSPSTATRPSTAQQLNNSATTLGFNADLSVEQSKNQPLTTLLYANLAPIAPLKLTKDKSRPYMKHRLTKIFRRTDVKGRTTDPYEP